MMESLNNRRRPRFSLLFDAPASLSKRRRRLYDAESSTEEQNAQNRLGYNRANTGCDGLEKRHPKKDRNGTKLVYWPPAAAEHFYLQVPAKLPQAEATRKVYSDYFLASANPYKARIAKFVRNSQTEHSHIHAVSKLSAEEHDAKYSTQTNYNSSKYHKNDKKEKERQSIEKKHRFSFKRDGIIALSQVIDLFCAGLFHEASNNARKREPKLKASKKPTVPIDFEPAISQGDDFKVPKRGEPVRSLLVSDIQHALDQLDWGLPCIEEKIKKTKKSER